MLFLWRWQVWKPHALMLITKSLSGFIDITLLYFFKSILYHFLAQGANIDWCLLLVRFEIDYLIPFLSFVILFLFIMIALTVAIFNKWVAVGNVPWRYVLLINDVCVTIKIFHHIGRLVMLYAVPLFRFKKLTYFRIVGHLGFICSVISYSKSSSIVIAWISGNFLDNNLFLGRQIGLIVFEVSLLWALDIW